MTLLGCSAPPPVFPPVEPPVLWPSSGDPARFAYVGEIGGEADLKRPQSIWSWLGNILGGTPPQGVFQSPSAVVMTAAGVLFVADPGAHVVHRLDLKTRQYSSIREAGEGQIFETPIGLALLGERPVVVDRTLHALIVLSPRGEPQAVLGKEVLGAPVGVAIGRSSRTLFVVDVKTHQVKALSEDGSLLFTVGKRGRGPGEFNYPTYIACDSRENLYVSDSLNFRVQVFDSSGRNLRSWGGKGDSPGEFAQPKGICLDARNRVYVVDSQFENVQVFDPEGRLLLAIGEEGGGPGQFWLPSGVFSDGEDRLWVSDRYNQRVQVFRYLPEATPGIEQ